jgi:hypothetical protein
MHQEKRDGGDKKNRQQGKQDALDNVLCHNKSILPFLYLGNGKQRN